MKKLTTRTEINRWLSEHGVKNFHIHNDLTVDVKSSVLLKSKGLTMIPVQFRKVEGIFDCSSNQLVSLKGCPKIVTDDFDCSDNLLQDLKDGPHKIGRDFLCNNNLLPSLRHAPIEVGGSFYCLYNPVDSLAQFNTIFKSDFYFKNGHKTSLKGFDEFFNHNHDLILPHSTLTKLLKKNHLEKMIKPKTETMHHRPKI